MLAFAAIFQGRISEQNPLWLYFGRSGRTIWCLTHEASIDTFPPLKYSAAPIRDTTGRHAAAWHRHIHQREVTVSATMPEPRTVRKTRAVRERATEISADLSEFNLPETQATDHFRLLQALIIDCGSLARQWRALVEYLSNAADARQLVDYRSLGEDAVPGAEMTLRLYEATAELAKPYIQNGTEFQDWADLVMAIREAKNVVEWVASWPTNDADQRQASCKALQHEEIADLHSMAT